ncbi:hypothetical protein, partial [uncultured Campylobacter sp.]|uniref:hypothetical protein n=1 Tax=uncultured Campylobacter sp. TaxID=218934 RepID=UPI00262766AA
MSRNFIFNARKQGGSAQNLNLRCGSDASKRSFGAHCDLGAYEHGHLPSARCDDLGIRRHGLLRSTRCRDFGAGGHRLLRDAKCYDFVACIDRPFRDIGGCDLSASGYSLSQDIGCRGSAAPKYELCSRANCDYNMSVLLSGAVRYGFAARNSALLCGDTYRGSSESPSSRLSLNASDPLQRVSDRPARTACPHCRFGANPDARLRCEFGADYFKNSGGISTRNFKNSARSLEAEPVQSFKNQNSTHGFSQSGRSAESNSELGFSQSIKNSEQNLPLSFLQSAKNSDQSQNFKSSFAQSHAEPNSVQNFSQSSKNSDRNFKTNSTQNQTEPVSPQELKNSDRNFKANSTQDNQAEPNSAGKREELGFYAPKFKDERARNFF